METNILTVQGRIRRSIFWIRWGVAAVINFTLGVVMGAAPKSDIILLVLVGSLLTSTFILIQGAKRMHDVGKSGWYFLIPIYNVILAFTDGTVGANEYGEDPKGRGDAWQCPACQTPNEANTTVCIQCQYQRFPATHGSVEQGPSDKRLLTYMALLLLHVVVIAGMQRLFLGLGSMHAIQYFHVATSLVWTFAPLLVVLSIQKKNLRTIALVVYVIYALWVVFQNIMWLQRI
ncbi:DUF805 domain-containing protein [Chryseolinea lacunae]|uniref:DUF805 domain-containing protein n=1 Tax=Chryseolinea lacunae TaxID=2801331 RepID=A0ABS1KKF1_9BACT|nr:DUF805 domain-containing protein [Chryseolinea lacunae]MBL0739722.1 DUF805 domain-containing protein [Chryseolinea lacunae]